MSLTASLTSSCHHLSLSLFCSSSVRLELYRQGWSDAGGDRFIRVPDGYKAGQVKSIQLVLTITQQCEVTLYIRVETDKFNSLATNKCSGEGDLTMVERTVKIDIHIMTRDIAPSRLFLIGIFILVVMSLVVSGEAPAGNDGWHDHANNRNGKHDQRKVTRR